MRRRGMIPLDEIENLLAPIPGRESAELSQI
jgi:hypothetical protein